jgi:hypothetical protein
MVYRYQPRAGAPIDAGMRCLVMEEQKVIATTFFKRLKNGGILLANSNQWYFNKLVKIP